MKRKILYFSIVICSVFVAISLFFSIYHPINIFGTNPSEFDIFLYNTFEYIGLRADILSFITGYPFIIFFFILCLGIWIAFFLTLKILNLLIGTLIIKKLRPKND